MVRCLPQRLGGVARGLSVVAIALAALVSVSSAQSTSARATGDQSDLDAFMSQVLARRDENWKKLQQYVLDEQETFQLTGPDGAKLWGFRREYAWFPREGFFIRSPVRSDGVTIGEAERRRAENEWLRREQQREKRRAERNAARGEPAPSTTVDPTTPASVEDAIRQSIEPQFISSAYFLRFRFEQGTYALAGREELLGRKVLRIEYYPTRLYRDGDRDGDRDSSAAQTDDDRQRRRRERQQSDKERATEQRIERQMNKVALVTLWVEPTAHQILQYEFKNIDLDFLPGRQLFRIDDITASMRMAQPFPEVWLPETIAMHFSGTTALGDVAARYQVGYHDYRLASVTTKVR